MRPGIATLIAVLILIGAIALGQPGWAIAVLGVIALACAAVDIARRRQARAGRT